MTQDAKAQVTLTIGSHLAPEDGVCLMEAVSIAAGLPFSDAPACTPPLLAHLARLVNDASSTAERQQLCALIPALAASGGASPDRHLTVDDLDAAIRLVRTCTDYALALHPTPLLRHFHALAVWLGQRDHQLRRAGRWSTLVRRPMVAAFLRGPAPRALEASVRACLAAHTDQRDPALTRLLRIGLAAAQRAAPSAAPTSGGESSGLVMMPTASTTTSYQGRHQGHRPNGNDKYIGESLVGSGSF